MMGESEFMEQNNKKKLNTQMIIKILLAVMLLGLSAFTKRGCLDLLDLVAAGRCAGIFSYAGYRQAVLAF